jgi:hypothetical protein
MKWCLKMASHWSKRSNAMILKRATSTVLRTSPQSRKVCIPANHYAKPLQLAQYASAWHAPALSQPINHNLPSLPIRMFAKTSGIESSKLDRGWIEGANHHDHHHQWQILLTALDNM